MEKIRDRKFVLVLYPEDVTHVECMSKIATGGYNYAAILHDNDVYEDGELVGQKKKLHWHVVLRFKNAVWNTALAKELGIEPNYIEQCRNLDGALVYLVHYGYDDKYQYTLEEVDGPLQTRLASLLADDDESTRAMNIYEIIQSSPGMVTYTEVFVKACKAGLYGDFRRMGSGVSCLIADHNRSYYDEFHRNRDTYNTKEEQRHFASFVEGYTIGNRMKGE